MNDELLVWLGSVSGDPYAFVMGAFPWGEKETQLEDEQGPEPWQIDILNDIRDGLPLDRAIQLATASGHGIGKTALVCWLILWAISTFPDTRGVVTANTESQLKTKTWAELAKWHGMFIAKEHFTLTATSLFSADSEHEKKWRIDQVPWSERTTEAFAGLHNKGRRLFVAFDEASAIPDVIWETTEGALTDANTQIIWAVFGNPTRNIGRFRECFPGQKHARAWKSRQIDSRTVSFTNKTQIQAWVDAYGEDSDFVRVRVRGVFPRTGELEFIPAEAVDAAMRRDVVMHKHDALVMGVDVARYGDNETVIFFRKGRDARTIPIISLRGADAVAVAGAVSDAYQRLRVDAVFVDGGGVGGGVVDVLRHLHVPCFDINFGSKPDGTGWATGDSGVRYANKRAEMWGAMREWLRTGAIPDDPELRAQLIGPTYTHNLRNEIQLEKKEDMRKRGLDSPDRADSLALTFAMPVLDHKAAGGVFPEVPLLEVEYNPYAEQRMAS